MSRRAVKVLSLNKVFRAELEGKKDTEITSEERDILQHLFEDPDKALQQGCEEIKAMLQQYRCKVCGHLDFPGLTQCECEEG